MNPACGSGAAAGSSTAAVGIGGRMVVYRWIGTSVGTIGAAATVVAGCGDGAGAGAGVSSCAGASNCGAGCFATDTLFWAAAGSVNPSTPQGGERNEGAATHVISFLPPAPEVLTITRT